MCVNAGLPSRVPAAWAPVVVGRDSSQPGPQPSLGSSMATHHPMPQAGVQQAVQMFVCPVRELCPSLGLPQPYSSLPNCHTVLGQV